MADLELPAFIPVADEGVLPAFARVPEPLPVGVAAGGFDPRRVRLGRAAGDFNAVVQVSAAHCLKVFHQELGVEYLSVAPPADALAAAALQIEAIARLGREATRTGGTLQVVFQLEPARMEFTAGARFSATFRASAAIGEFETRPIRVPAVPDLRFAGVPARGPGGLPGPRIRTPAPGEITLSPGFIPARMLRAPAPEPAPRPRGATGLLSAAGRAVRRVAGGLASLVPGLSRRASTRGEQAHFAGMLPSQGLSLVFFRSRLELGTLELTVTGEYRVRARPNRAEAAVVADLRAAEVRVTAPPGDLQKLYALGFFGPDGAELRRQLLRAEQAHLVPRLSLVGPLPAHATVPELPDFEALAFHVNGDGRQALAVGFDLRPGCRGIVEEVEHFIGAADYGVISDEFLVERMFKHRWNQGALPRALPLQMPTRVTYRVRNLEIPVDVVLHGTLRLDTLDVVAIDTVANARDDFLMLAGRARLTTESATLADGRSVDPGQITLPPPDPRPWTLLTVPSVLPGLSENPLLRAFQQRAHSEMFRYLARPFAHPAAPLARVRYCRLDAVTKQAFFLGRFTEAFA